MDVLWLRVCEQWRMAGGLRLKFALKFIERGAEIVIHVRCALVQFGQGRRRGNYGCQDGVPGDEGVVAVGFEQLLQRVHGSERRDVLFVNHHGAHPDGWLGKPRAAIMGESVLHDYTLAGELTDLGSEVDGG